MGATILDVAKLCGYSKTTISRAFASPEKVSEKTRTIIYKAAKEINYTPDAIARAMVRKKTDNIGFIVADQQYPVVLNPFYSPVFEGVLRTCKEKGYSVFIASESDIHISTGQVYMKKQMDGVIICGQTDKATIESFKSQNIPVVLLNNIIDMNDLVCVAVDNYNGTVQAVEHLIQRGHVDIAIISGNFSPNVYNARYRAFVDTMKKHGLEIDERFVKRVEPSLEASMECTTQLLAQKREPTAIFATNDVIAIGAMKVALRAGYKLPEDLAIVGFDDSDYSEIVEPELSTVRINKLEIGKVASERLIEIIEGKAAEKEVILSETTLLVRATS